MIDDLPTTSIRPFVSPARVVLGGGAIALLPREFGVMGVEPGFGSVLIVADRALVDLGVVAALGESLEESGYRTGLGAPVDGEPSVEIVDALIAAGRSSDARAVVGIGGGSSMDAAKLAAAGIGTGTNVAGLSADPAAFRSSPLALVPTTAGTGAEATAIAMLWDGPRKRMFAHPQLVPRVAVLDPALLAHLPSTVTAAGGLDALSHAVESLISTFRTPLTDVHAYAAIDDLAASLRVAYHAGTVAAREATLRAAFNAGLALNASVVLGHSIAYAVCARGGLPHGVGCAMALPYCMAYCRPAVEAELGALATRVHAGADGRAFLRWVAELNDDLGMPRDLEAVGISSGDLSQIAHECVEFYPRPNCPVRLEESRVEDLLGHMWSGSLEDAWEAMEAA